MSHRDRLLEAARACLETKGYARTTARDLVNASGTNLASIGYHFGSKEALLNEAIGQAFVDWTQEVMQTVERETPADAPLERMLAGWRAMLERTSANRALIVANLEGMAQVARDDGVRERMAAAYAECRARLARTVEESIPEGVEIDSRVIASFLMAVVDGMTLQRFADPARAPDGDEMTRVLRLALPFIATPGAPED